MDRLLTVLTMTISARAITVTMSTSMRLAARNASSARRSVPAGSDGDPLRRLRNRRGPASVVTSHDTASAPTRMPM